MLYAVDVATKKRVLVGSGVPTVCAACGAPTGERLGIKQVHVYQHEDKNAYCPLTIMGDTWWTWNVKKHLDADTIERRIDDTHYVDICTPQQDCFLMLRHEMMNEEFVSEREAFHKDMLSWLIDDTGRKSMLDLKRIENDDGSVHWDYKLRKAPPRILVMSRRPLLFDKGDDRLFQINEPVQHKGRWIGKVLIKSKRSVFGPCFEGRSNVGGTNRVMHRPFVGHGGELVVYADTGLLYVRGVEQSTLNGKQYSYFHGKPNDREDERKLIKTAHAILRIFGMQDQRVADKLANWLGHQDGRINLRVSVERIVENISDYSRLLNSPEMPVDPRDIIMQKESYANQGNSIEQAGVHRGAGDQAGAQPEGA